MNAQSQAQRAYSAVSAPTRTARSAEYEAVARITTKIKLAMNMGAAGFGPLVEALYENRKLWNIFAIEAADDHNPLPAPLRARIVYLADFTNQHTAKILRREADASALLDINQAILKGLKGSGA